MTHRIELLFGFALEVDMDLDRGRIDSAWWSWRGLTLAEVPIGLA